MIDRLAAEHAILLISELESFLEIRGGSIRLRRTSNGRFWATWVKQTTAELEGPVGPVVTDDTLRGALANLLEAMNNADHT